MGRIAFIGWRSHGEHSRTKEWRVNIAAADSLTVPDNVSVPAAADNVSVPATPRRTDSPAAADNVTPNVLREEKIKSKSAAARDPNPDHA